MLICLPILYPFYWSNNIKITDVSSLFKKHKYTDDKKHIGDKKENGAVYVLSNKITIQIKMIIIKVSNGKSTQDNVKNKNEGEK